ncbi:Uncharacterised protein [Mycobacterium tuberculosis]|nr:Uncharacterised protein [Mycobacterium tuberculosis]
MTAGAAATAGKAATAPQALKATVVTGAVPAAPVGWYSAGMGSTA